MTHSVPQDLQDFIRLHPACEHPFLARLSRAGVGSEALTLFAREYAILRRGARAVDACCPQSEERFADFLRSCGVGVPADEHALPGTRMALDGLRDVLRDPRLHDGSLWAIEQVGRSWAQGWLKTTCSRGTWDIYWQELSRAEDWVRTPRMDAMTLSPWYEGARHSLNRLANFLDGLEAAVTTLQAA